MLHTFHCGRKTEYAESFAGKFPRKYHCSGGISSVSIPLFLFGFAKSTTSFGNIILVIVESATSFGVNFFRQIEAIVGWLY